MLLLGLLFDFGFDVVARFISWFKKNIEENLVFTLKLKKVKILICFLFGFQIKENVVAGFALWFWVWRRC